MSVKEVLGATAEELFQRADKNGDGFVDPAETVAFFPSFQQLERAQLKQIWDACVSDGGKGFSKAEFFIAMDMVAQFVAAAKTSNTVEVATTQVIDYSISDNEREFYVKYFKSVAGEDTELTGAQCKDFFAKSGLPMQDLRTIWGLADVNVDGKLNMEEFGIAMHLIRIKTKNPDLEFPTELPASLQPKHAAPSPVAERVQPQQKQQQQQQQISNYQQPPQQIVVQPVITVVMKRPQGGELETLQYFLQAARDELATLQKSMPSQATIDQLRKQEMSMAQDIDRAKTDLKQYQQRKDALTTAIATIYANVDVKNYEKAVLHADMQFLNQAVAQFKAEVAAQNSSSKNNDVKEILAQIAQTQSTITTQKNEHGQLLARKQEMEGKFGNLQRENETTKQSLAKKVANEKEKASKCAQMAKNVEAAIAEYKNTLKQDAKMFVEQTKAPEPKPATPPPKPAVNVAPTIATPPASKPVTPVNPLPQPPKLVTPATPTALKPQPPVVIPSPASPMLVSPPRISNLEPPAPKFDDFETSFDDGFGNGFDDDDGFGTHGGWDNAPKPQPPHSKTPEVAKPATPVITNKILPEPPKLFVPDSPQLSNKLPDPPKLPQSANDGFDEFETFANDSVAPSDWESFNNNNSSVTTGLDEWSMEFGDVKSPPPKQAPIPTVTKQPAANAFDDSFDASFDDNF